MCEREEKVMDKCVEEFRNFQTFFKLSKKKSADLGEFFFPASWLGEVTKAKARFVPRAHKHVQKKQRTRTNHPTRNTFYNDRA